MFQPGNQRSVYEELKTSYTVQSMGGPRDDPNGLAQPHSAQAHHAATSAPPRSVDLRASYTVRMAPVTTSAVASPATDPGHHSWLVSHGGYGPICAQDRDYT